MRVVEFSRHRAEPIESFGSVAASSVSIAGGSGEAHVHCVYFEPGGSIGRHPTGFGQLFLVVAGSGWIAAADGVRVPLFAGQGAVLEKGEIHSKGSDAGMTALMVQVTQIQAPGAT
jgi:quercetin dioxygenase-like cupin family protein